MPTFNPIQTITLIPSGAINAFRFVAFDGAQAVAGQRARGITHDGALDTDKAVSVITLGTAIIEAGAAFSAEALLVSDALGKAIEAVAASGDVINAIAVDAAEAPGDLVEVVLVSPITKA